MPTVTYALRDREADVYVTKFNEQNIWGTDLEVRTPFGLLNIFTDQVGKQNVYNILCAVATGLALGTISLTVRVEDSFLEMKRCCVAALILLCLCTGPAWIAGNSGG